MRKKYRLELEIGLDESDVQRAIQIARSHFRKAGPASTPVNWNRINGKWRRITAEEFIPDGEIAIMELIDANDLLDAAGIEVTSVSCVEVKPEKTVLDESSDSKLKHPSAGRRQCCGGDVCESAGFDWAQPKDSSADEKLVAKDMSRTCKLDPSL
jgi:hypothetical protein